MKNGGDTSCSVNTLLLCGNASLPTIRVVERRCAACLKTGRTQDVSRLFFFSCKHFFYPATHLVSSCEPKRCVAILPGLWQTWRALPQICKGCRFIGIGKL